MKRRRVAQDPPSILSALHLREQGLLRDDAFRRATHSALVPSATFANVSGVPPVTLRRFTPCGRFLIGIAHNQRDLAVFRFESGGRRALAPNPSTGLDFARTAFQPRRAQAEPLFDSSRPHPGSSANRFGSPLLFDLPPGYVAPPPPPPGLLSTLPVPLRGSAGAPPSPAATGVAANRRESVSYRHSCHFGRFFHELYQAPIALGQEVLLREFCLATPKGSHIILASYHKRDGDALVEQPRLGVPMPANGATPLLESFTLHLVHIETGIVADRFTLTHDFVALQGHAGVHMRGDMLCVLSIRYQQLHIIKVQENLGRFTVEGRIGSMCNPDDEMVINRAADSELVYRRRRAQEQRQGMFSGPSGAGDLSEQTTGAATGEPVRSRAETRARAASEGDGGEFEAVEVRQGPAARTEAQPTETGLGGGKLKSGFYTGLMQRLLVYVYRKYHEDRHQSLFYRVVGQYSLLVMLKAQFLDDDHLLIRLGSHERSAKPSESAQTNTCFFVVYCISTTQILNLFENRSTELLAIYEKYRDMFIGDPAMSATLPPRPTPAVPPRSVSREGAGSAERDDRGRQNVASGSGSDATWSYSGMGAAAAAGRERRVSSLKRTRAELSALPVSCQTGNVSAYLDRSVFSYNTERMNGLDGTRPVSLRDINAVKFLAARTGLLRFKLAPGLAGLASSGRARHEGTVAVQRKRRALFLFHPILPFVVSMEVHIVTPVIYNFHVYGFREQRDGSEL